MTKYFAVILFSLLWVNAFGQKTKADSIGQLLAQEKIDSNRVRLMWEQASAVYIYNPELALIQSQQALYLARQIKYIEGQSRSLGVIANCFFKIGNYPSALEYNIEKLQLEEKRNNPRNLASVLMNIGIVYVFQEEYQQALLYYHQSDSVITQNNIEALKYYIKVNLGDVYDRLNISDSAYPYFYKSLEIAKNLRDDDLTGASMTGLGHSYRKMGKYDSSLLNYRSAISHLQAANDDDLLCEATLGLAKLYQQINKSDSATYYAGKSLSVSNKAGFLSRQLDAVEFLKNHYKQLNNIDSAYSYITLEQTLNDSLNSKSRIRELQIISSNEQVRQLEIEENKKIAARERFQQLQLLFIGIFIPGFFLFTLLLSRIKIHVRVIRMLGILSLLILFEYLTLFLHPYVKELTHHIPVYEMLIFVSIAAILIPAHHRLEKWLIEILISNRTPKPEYGKIKIKTSRLKIKRKSG